MYQTIQIHSIESNSRPWGEVGKSPIVVRDFVILTLEVENKAP